MQYLSDNPLRSRLMGESQLWEGKPLVTFRSLFGVADIFLIPFSIFWTGFAVFWMASAYMMGAPIFFTLFGTPFVLIGMFLLFGRFILSYLSLRGTYYLLTDKRVLVQSGLFNSYTSIALNQLGSLTVNAGKDGYGTINYSPFGFPLQTQMLGQTPMAAQTQFRVVGFTPMNYNGYGMQTVLFKNIENVDYVYKLLTDAIDKNKTTQAATL